MLVSYSQIGPHNVSCCIYNKVSEVCTTLPFNVLTRVSGLVLTYANSSYDISPGQAAHIRVSVKEGSEVQVDGIIEGETIIVPIRWVLSQPYYWCLSNYQEGFGQTYYWCLK